MRRRHCIKEHIRFTPNTYNYLETDPEKIIEETRRNLDNFLNNLREHASIKDSLLYFPKEEKKSSSNNKRKKIYHQKEKAPFYINKASGNNNHNIPFINLPETITNTCNSCSNTRQTKNNYYQSVQSEPQSDKRLRSISNKKNVTKNIVNVISSIDEKKIKRIQSDIQFIQNSNNENKKELLNLSNLQKQLSEELLSKVNEYIFHYIQKENELTKYINDFKIQEQNEIQRYKHNIDSLSQMKDSLMKDYSSLSQENKEKTNEIEKLKQELKNIRNERTEKDNEIKKTKIEIKDLQIRNDKIIQENSNLKIQLQELEKNKSQPQHLYPKLFNKEILKKEITFIFDYNSQKRTDTFKIENITNNLMYSAILKPKIVFKIVKSFEKTLQYNKKKFNNKDQTISSEINSINYLQSRKQNKILTMISPDLTFSINSVSKPQQEDKEKTDLKNQLQYVTQKYKSLLKSQTSEKKKVNKEKENSSENNNDLLLKEQEITKLKFDLEKATNELAKLKKENEVTPTSSQNIPNISGIDNKTFEKTLKDLEDSNQEKENIKKENRQLQHKLQDTQTEIKKYREQIKALTTDKVKFEIKETTLNNQIESLYDEIESLKEELELKEEEEKNQKRKLQKLIDKGLDERESMESLKEKITMLRMELNQNHENINKAREVLQKAKSFDECSKSMDIVLKDYVPNNEEQINAIKLLKIIFGFKTIKLASSSEQLNEDTNPMESSKKALNTNEQLEVGRGSSLKQKGYLKELLKNKEKKAE